MHTITISDEAYEHLQSIMSIYSGNKKFRKEQYEGWTIPQIKQNVIETALYTELQITEERLEYMED